MRNALVGVSLALIAAILFVYSPACHYGFLQYDDPVYVSNNVDVAKGLSAQNVRWAFTTGHAASWHPLTWLSHMSDVHFFGMNAEYHHDINILLHILNALLLFWVLQRMTGAWRPSAFVAALFAVHPLHVESVAWIAERKDVLSTLFWMLTLHAYVRYVQSPRVHRYLAVVAAFALGLMSKSMVVTLPFVLLLFDIWPLARVSRASAQTWMRLVLEKVPLFGLAVAASIVTFMAQMKGGTVLHLENFPLRARVANALVSYCAYLKDMLWPGNLAAYYPFESTPGILVLGCLIALTAISILVLRSARRYPYLLAGWLFYLVTLAPVIGLIQVGDKSRADRFTYVPLIGIFILAAWGVPQLLGAWRYRRVALTATAGVILCALAFAARNQVENWKDDRTLWEHTLRITGDNYFAHHNLGMALLEQGDLDGASKNYLEALRINRESAETHNALSNIFLKQGRFNEALDEASEAIHLKADLADAHCNRGAAYASMGKIDEAIADFNNALSMNPSCAEVHYNLGLAMAMQGKADEASAWYQRALRLKPEYAEAHNSFGYLLMNRNRNDEAIAHFKEALRINPEFAQAHNNLGQALINGNHVDEAIVHFREALRIQPGWTYAINNLGVALMDCRRNAEAAYCFSEALQIDPNDKRARHNLELVSNNNSR
jgi:tetratricopeptide (TPR) repeat protein